MSKEKTNKYLIAALLIGLLFHGTSIFFTLENTYDALIHLFFGSHYAQSWFEPWNYSWYTGFTVMGYPPLVHQSIGLLSLVGGLKFALFTVAICGVLLFITGIYRFALLLTANRKVAGYAALLAVFSSSFIETLHIFGQLPSIIGLSVLLHTLPQIYLWLKTGRFKHLALSFSMLAITITSHHITPIFGMVFFIFPLIGMVLMDAAKEKLGAYKGITFVIFITTLLSHLKRILIFGLGSLALIIFCILPYWINSKNNPITQVPIPHGSRDNFLEVTSSGLVFFLIPWGGLLLFWPYIMYRFFSKRYLFFGFSFVILTILGTGGTTDIPLMVLGENAFNILTLDRFTLWATVMALPIFGEFSYRFVEADIKSYLQKKWGTVTHRIAGGVIAGLLSFTAILTINLGNFRPSQPDKIDMLPIVNFLHEDDHEKWRYLTLGFGDQMALLSAKTKAMTVDGNYHSARRLPELTTRAVERLENSKFRGVEGLGSLQQFLTVPEKYHLKYVFSNDKFYDPILYFSGWHRLQQLHNGIEVWERSGVPPLPTVLPKEDVAKYQKMLWGIIPLLTVVFVILLQLRVIWKRKLKTAKSKIVSYMSFQVNYRILRKGVFSVSFLWATLMVALLCLGSYKFYVKNTAQRSPENVITAYFDALDFKNFDRAYDLVSPNNKKSKSQFMLEISVSDGLLQSYAKLNAINTEVIQNNDITATVSVKTNWITPLKAFKKEALIDVSKVDGKWYVNLEEIDFDIPPDQLFSQNSTRFYNHGRRRVTSGATYHEDVLQQPFAEVTSASLVASDNGYAIIGNIQNIDNVPADIAINATLYSEANELLASFNAKDILKHKLLPKEKSNFRIDFEDIAWANNKDHIPTIFNPYEFTSIVYKNKPVKFNLHIASNVATADLFDGLALQNVTVANQTVSGTLFNTSIQNVTIPQLLISYYNEDKELIWVDKQYLEESVRPQLKQKFTMPLASKLAGQLRSNNIEQVYINGLPNASQSRKALPLRDQNLMKNNLIPVSNKTYAYISLQLNSFIGNPL